MKKPSETTIDQYLDQHSLNAYAECMLSDDTYLENLEDFCENNGFDLDDAVNILTELFLLDNWRLTPCQKYIDDGLFEKVLIREKLGRKVVYRFRTFITIRGAFFLELS